MDKQLRISVIKEKAFPVLRAGFGSANFTLGFKVGYPKNNVPGIRLIVLPFCKKYAVRVIFLLFITIGTPITAVC